MTPYPPENAMDTAEQGNETIAGDRARASSDGEQVRARSDGELARADERARSGAKERGLAD